MDIDAWRLVLDAAAVGLALCSIAYAHWRTQARATQKDIEGLEYEVRALRERMIRAEGRLDETPTSKALHDLALSIEHFGGDLRAVVQRLDGMGAIIDRLENVTNRQEDWIRSASRSAK